MRKRKKNIFKIANKGIWTKIYFKGDITKIKKTFSILLLILIIIGYSFLVIYHLVVLFSIPNLKILPENLNQYQPTNDTIIFEGNFLIKTQIPISDFNLKFSVLSENETLLLNFDIYKKYIPSGKNTNITYYFMINSSEIESEKWDLLLLSEYLFLEFNLSLIYGWTGLRFKLLFEVEII